MFCASFKAERPSNERQLVIGEDQVDCRVFQTAEELGARLCTRDFTGNIIRFKELLNERRVSRVILQQENSQRRRHDTLLHTAGRRLVDHRPKHAKLLNGIDEFVEIDRLHHIGIHAELVASHHVLFLVG
jgi:hypothetical protein